MAKYSGKALKILWTPTSDTQKDISGKYRSFDVNETTKLAQVTSQESAYEEYVAIGIIDSKVSYQALDTDDEVNPFSYVKGGQTGVLEWAPAGNTSGKPKRYANAIVQSRKVNFPYDNAVVLNVEFQITGLVTETTYA